jgi:hypothetical protein
LDKNFTGWIYLYDWNDNPQGVAMIKNGRTVKGYNRKRQTPNNNQQGNRYEVYCANQCQWVLLCVGSPIIPQFADDPYYYCPPAYSSWYQVCHPVCINVWIPDDYNNGNNPPDPSDDCNYWGTCNNDPVPPDENQLIDEIDVSGIQNQCLRDVYNKITTAKYKNDCSEMIRAFQKNPNITIYFLQADLGDTAYATTTNLDDGWFGIQLDTRNLVNCSQEFIADTYFHEIIHVKLFSDSTSWDFVNNNQHQYMLLNYVDIMTNSLMQIFPTLDKLDAYCISYSGMLGGRDANQQAVLTSMRDLFFKKKIQPLATERGINNFSTYSAGVRAYEFSENGIRGTRTNCNNQQQTGNQ